MPAPPGRPRQNQLDATRWRKQEMGQQMTHFGNAQRPQISRRGVALVSRLLLTRKCLLSRLMGGSMALMLVALPMLKRATAGGSATRMGWGPHVCGGRSQRTILDTDADQKGQRQHDQGDMTVPSHETAHFVVIQSQIFAVLVHLLQFSSVPQERTLWLAEGFVGEQRPDSTPV